MADSDSGEAAYDILFHQDDLVPELPDEQLVAEWISQILKQESKALRRIDFVFLDDNALLQINRDHLQHDTFTDIITFPYKTDPIEAEIYISVDRVRENARSFSVAVVQELLRVMAHGVLHLCGWNDKTASDVKLMRSREDACLTLWGLPYSASSPV